MISPQMREGGWPLPRLQ